MDWTLNWTALRLLLDVMTLFGFIAVGLYSWWVSRSRAATSQIELANQRIGGVEVRVKTLENNYGHLPTHNDLAQLSERIGTLHSDLSEIKGALRGLARAVDLMNEHLINRGRDGG